MVYTAHYRSPLGGILMAADEEGLTGLWFEGQKYFARGLAGSTEDRETAAAGWTSISPGASPDPRRRCTLWARSTSAPSGTCCSPSPTAAP